MCMNMHQKEEPTASETEFKHVRSKHLQHCPHFRKAAVLLLLQLPSSSWEKKDEEGYPTYRSHGDLVYLSVEKSMRRRRMSEN